jgi:Cu+-exporting ATPase
MKTVLKTKGMHCVSCERVIQDALIELKGVKSAKANYTNERTEIEFDPEKINVKKIMEAVKEAGYEPEELNEKEEKKGLFKKLFGG